MARKAKKEKTKKLIIKLKDKSPPKVRSVGMNLGVHRIEARPKVIELKESEMHLLDTTQFEHYMELVKQPVGEFEVGAYTDGLKTADEVRAEKVNHTEPEETEADEADEETEAEDDGE